ncbi:hypothetical protein FSO04_33205 [Paraburkholderia madseniana]|uniref:Uncharacterized protein n=1 Tax=Paraburkholderia madseniana TaxID=2599607 RepID=A0A6N6W4M9_9BURK|nr:hypothetical protein [Paraburkholderia madseniana]KAE8755627.1 hypothetical protein FSO04_33205 [Paraburkholderia madseniana]
MSFNDPIFGQQVSNGARVRTSAPVGSRILCQDGELEVLEIGPFVSAANGMQVRFRARLTEAGRLLAGTVIHTPWGVCEVVD